MSTAVSDYCFAIASEREPDWRDIALELYPFRPIQRVDALYGAHLDRLPATKKKGKGK